jgi:hypothetical protein
MRTQTTAISYAVLLEQAASGRHQAIAETFDARLFSLTSLMGPMSSEWPSDASWLTLAHHDCACIISDGLSDPWVERDRPDTGLGLEVFLETPDLAVSEEQPMAIADTWLFPMTAEVSHTLASYPRLCEKLLAGIPLSLRFNIEHIKDGRGLAGALLHRPPDLPDLDMATGTVALVAATLLTNDELHWLVGRGEAGRRELLEALYQSGIGSRSLLQRASVVGGDSL